MHEINFHHTLKKQNSHDTTITHCSLYMCFKLLFPLYPLDLPSSRQYVFWFLLTGTCKSIAWKDSNYSETALLLKNSLSSLYHCAVPPNAGTSACAVEHNLSTDWVKCILAKQKQRQFFSSTPLSNLSGSHTNMCWQYVGGNVIVDLSS